MTDRPASWRMPTRAQMEKMAHAVGRKAPQRMGWPRTRLAGRILAGAPGRPSRRRSQSGAGRIRTRAAAGPNSSALLRVHCRRCGRTVEIQKVDAVRLYGRDANWRGVGRRLLNNSCSHRTGPHEEDGCWPSTTRLSRRTVMAPKHHADFRVGSRALFGGSGSHFRSTPTSRHC